MQEKEASTHQQILDAGKKEFLLKGYLSASLRNIVKEAGVTTGAFYGYYKSKEDLFDALVAEPYQVLMAKFTQAQNAFASLPPEEQPEQMGEISGDCMDWMVGYIYAHFDAFKLLLCSSEGTKYEHFIHTMVEIEVEGTHTYLAVLNELGRPSPKIDPKLEHILITGMFHTFFELVIHEMPLRDAENYIREMRAFYTAGWMKIMGQ